MPSVDIRDLNIRYAGHPKYNSDRIIEDRTLEFVIQKLENVLFTNRGEVLGDPNFGANLEYYLWTTNVPVDKIKQEIINQINIYIPELNSMGFKINTELYEGTARDILMINMTIQDIPINFVIK
jgi:phage baseplate assembly protein W